MEEVGRYADMDPADLLPENRHLLEVDFGKLGKGAAVDGNFWAVEMGAAVATAAHVMRSLLTTQIRRSRYYQGP